MSAPAANGPYTLPLIFNGKDYYTEKTFDVISPSTAKVLYRSSAVSVADSNKAVELAAEALKSWRNTTPAQRRDIMLKAADNMARRSEELVNLMSTDTGTTDEWSKINVDAGVDMIKACAGLIPTLEGSFPTLNDPDMSGIMVKEPYGVVFAIAPWNSPYVLGTRSIAFPLAAGNTVVFKGSELSPRTMWGIASCFQEAGLPDGVLNFIVHAPGDGAEITSAIISHPEVKKINFTGSTNVGRVIGRLAGDYTKPVILELGGKAPAIVWEDADIELAAFHCALGAFMNSGQICMSTEKIIVHKSIKSKFAKALVAAVAKRYPGSDDAPVLINSAAVKKNKALVANAQGKGGNLLTGNPSAEESTATRLRPIVVDNVTTDMDIYNQESFGPTVSLLEVDTEEEALRLANDTEYGLSSSVYTENLRTGLRFARQIEAGAVHINAQTVHDEPCLPHGGVKGSGYGRFNGVRGLDEWVRTKNITFRK
ncbi:hypothetical protein PLIIFM63780_006574 [Purpureocillium lilacinum]|nr:hypothetical protein PLIIFM63780_006574 [Purpureocillium lilacinum]